MCVKVLYISVLCYKAVTVTMNCSILIFNYYNYKMQQKPLDTQIGGNHYKDLKIQPIEYIMANNLNYCQGNAIKYLTRYKDKNGLEDLKKAKHYIDILIQLEYPNEIKDTTTAS